MRPDHLKSAAILGAKYPHGTRMRYMGGCKCIPCRAANSRYETQRSALRRAGLDNGLTCADRAREHLLNLSKKGIGRRCVSEAAGVAHSIVSMIKNGKRKQIRKDTERRILAINVINAAKGATLIDARPCWRLIKKLLKEGFTKKSIAKILGYKTGAIQLNKKRVIVRNAIRVKHLYDKVMEG
jgi:hypothetical protein